MFHFFMRHPVVRCCRCICCTVYSYWLDLSCQCALCKHNVNIS